MKIFCQELTAVSRTGFDRKKFTIKHLPQPHPEMDENYTDLSAASQAHFSCMEASIKNWDFMKSRRHVIKLQYVIIKIFSVKKKDLCFSGEASAEAGGGCASTPSVTEWHCNALLSGGAGRIC